ncbi:GGDEF domain-containing protein [Pseudoalteromonas rubra]|uniref:GGDEF domain-containing protein n=1 Tax=Pseudoalteromonas rubra TaxID=43658 RepID=A0A5S3WNU2_9GAMM|nr:GGDEF domain-containing phosphodiesterase [Pseudoalteromonas rubra]TMP29933.1 GGDEF domain-containing protein [Pseudoalteromonas rubra]TMP32161.1 GGDEF domain-containing protein [Pseudoalteromonas rubra]
MTKSALLKHGNISITLLLVLFAPVVSAATFWQVSGPQSPMLVAFVAGTLLSASVAAIMVSQQPLHRLLYATTTAVVLAYLANTTYYFSYLLAPLLVLHVWLALRSEQLRFQVITCLSACGAALALAGTVYWQLTPGLLVVALLPMFLAELMLARTPHIQAQQAANEESKAADILELPDRAGFRSAFYEFRQRDPSAAMLVMIRLEGFQQVNFHLGREFGDLLLAQSANRIKQHLQHPDVMPVPLGNDVSRLAHLGGLHFVFVCSLVNQHHLHEQMINEIIESTLKPFNVGNCTIEVKARASYVNCDEEQGQFENLLTCAFLALDSQPDSPIAPYQQQMQINRLEQQARLAELAHIDFRKELELYFQPVVRNEDGDIEFLELLLRWQHPKQGILAAGKFIEDIRIAGLALPVAQYVIERAAEIALALRVEGIAMPLSLNLFGPEMLHEEFIEFIDHVLLEHQLKPGDLIIECPSSLFTSLDPQGIAMVSRLRSIGVRLCIDSFGETPVTLSKLPQLTVDYVKLGRSLTLDHGNQGSFKSVVRGIVEMQQIQECKVICEGVESPEQLQFVKSLNTFAAQGYYFARPLSSVGMISWLKQWRWEHPEDASVSPQPDSH